MGRLFWECECGERWEEKGREEPGNDLGWKEARTHSHLHKTNGEPERLRGLVDEETGELVFTGGWRPIAVKQGILPYGSWRQKRAVSAPGEKIGPFQGRVLIRDIPIDPTVMLAFYEAQVLFPGDYPDDNPKTVSKFITECVFGFYALNSDIFSFGNTIKNTLIQVGAKLPQAEAESLSEEAL